MWSRGRTPRRVGFCATVCYLGSLQGPQYRGFRSGYWQGTRGLGTETTGGCYDQVYPQGPK